MRVPGPQDHAKPAPEILPTSDHESRDLEHGRIGAGVVHGAEMPGVEMTGQHDEGGLRVRMPWQKLGFDDGRLDPSGLHRGVDVDSYGAAGAELAQRFPVAPPHGDEDGF